MTIQTNEELLKTFSELKESLILAGKISVKHFTIFVQNQDEFFDGKEGKEYIEKVWFGNQADFHLTEYLKQYDKEYQPF